MENTKYGNHKLRRKCCFFVVFFLANGKYKKLISAKYENHGLIRLKSK